MTTTNRVEVHLIEDPAIERQIQGIITALVERLKITAALEVWHGWDAKALADTLAGRYEYHMGPRMAAHIVLNGLLDPCVAKDPQTWGTPLGRALAFWGDGDTGHVTRACAAAALGYTRQNVALMLRDGRLSSPPNAGTDDLVTTASLAHAMRVRFPLGG